MYWWFGSLHRPKIPQSIYIYDSFCLFVYFFIYIHIVLVHISNKFEYLVFIVVYIICILYINVCFINIYVWVMRLVMNT